MPVLIMHIEKDEASYEQVPVSQNRCEHDIGKCGNLLGVTSAVIFLRVHFIVALALIKAMKARSYQRSPHAFSNS